MDSYFWQVVDDAIKDLIGSEKLKKEPKRSTYCFNEEQLEEILKAVPDAKYKKTGDGMFFIWLE